MVRARLFVGALPVAVTLGGVMKGILQYLLVIATAGVVGVGFILVDARSNPALWYVLWIASLVAILMLVVLEWNTQSRWLSMTFVVLFYVPTYAGSWLASWDYISWESFSWIVLVCGVIAGVVQINRSRCA